MSTVFARLVGTTRGGTRVVPAPPPERGAVTAEAAVVLPVLALFTMALVWVVSLAVTQIRVVDAARETARVAARGDSVARALESGRTIAPAAARVSLHRGMATVTAQVSAEVRGPGGLLTFLPAVTVRSQAVATTETP